MEEVYTEINAFSCLETFALIVGAKELRDSLSGCVDRSKIQPRASQSNTSHRDITHNLINISVKVCKPFWICYKNLRKCDGATQQQQNFQIRQSQDVKP